MPIRPSLFAFTAILIASTLAAHADTVEFTFTPTSRRIWTSRRYL